MDDKVVHSAVGLGFYLSAILTLNAWALLALVSVAVGKELIDWLRYGDFDEWDLLATLNPMIVIRWYFRITN